jgi:PHD/YefM family antitoxin component YafN of YafNO toxin-antitoxin module
MKAQIIKKDGKKEFVVIPYDDFVKMQEALEDYEDLKELRKAKESSKGEKPIPFDQVVKDLGLNE